MVCLVLIIGIKENLVLRITSKKISETFTSHKGEITKMIENFSYGLEKSVLRLLNFELQITCARSERYLMLFLPGRPP